MIGSSKGYLPDDDVKGAKKLEKLKIIKKREDRIHADRASVKYNFQDFLSQ